MFAFQVRPDSILTGIQFPRLPRNVAAASPSVPTNLLKISANGSPVNAGMRQMFGRHEANVWSTKCWKGKVNNATGRLTYLSVEQSWQKWSPHVSHWRTHPWHTVRSQNWQWWLPAVWRHVSHTANIYTVLTFTANIHTVRTLSFTANIHTVQTFSFTANIHTVLTFIANICTVPTFTTDIHAELTSLVPILARQSYSQHKVLS